MSECSIINLPKGPACKDGYKSREEAKRAISDMVVRYLSNIDLTKVRFDNTERWKKHSD